MQATSVLVLVTQTCRLGFFTLLKKTLFQVFLTFDVPQLLLGWIGESLCAAVTLQMSPARRSHHHCNEAVRTWGARESLSVRSEENLSERPCVIFLKSEALGKELSLNTHKCSATINRGLSHNFSLNQRFSLQLEFTFERPPAHVFNIWIKTVKIGMCYLGLDRCNTCETGSRVSKASRLLFFLLIIPLHITVEGSRTGTTRGCNEAHYSKWLMIHPRETGSPALWHSQAL